MKTILKLKKIVPILIIFFILFIVELASAQFPADGQYQSIMPPATPNIPDYGQSVIDNSVPSAISITRITEAYDYVDGNGNPQVWYPTHEYSKTQVWNADQTKYKVVSWKVYNATTYQEERELSDMYPSYWSNTDADVIWCFRENGDVKKYNVSTNSAVTVANIPGYEFIKVGPGEGNIDKNDHYIALVGKKANGNTFDLDVIIFDLQTAQIVSTRNFPSAWEDGPDYAPKYIDWVSVSQSGNSVVIMWNHNTSTDDGVNQYIENGKLHYGVEVYNTLDMSYQRRIIRYGNHGDLGYAVDGKEVLVQGYGLYGSGSLYMHYLDGSGSVVLTTNTDFGGAGHVSCRNINRPGWAYLTFSLSAQTGQMVAIKLDESGTVEHFGHHFSSAMSYEQAAMAVASPNGDKICFKSDFGTDPISGSKVAYSFFASLANPSPIEEETTATLNAYPNPAQDFITIENSNNIKNIIIYNDIGQAVKKVANLNSTIATINLKNLKRGFYYMHISTNYKSILKKIIKQ